MEKLLTIQQVRDILQVSKRTIYDWTHIGYIPHYKLPNGVRFRKSEIERWLMKKRRSGRSTYRI